MKNIIIIYFFLTITFISCDNKEEKIDADYFKNKTFTFYGNDSITPFKVNFDDSTFYQIEEKPTIGNWKLYNYNNNDFLILNNVVFGVKTIPNENDIELINIAQNEFNFKISLNKLKYKKDKILGEWVDKKTDSSDVVILTLPPPLPPNSNNENYEKTWPPKMIITKDSIFYEYLNFRSKSEYKIDNSNQFILLNLETELSFENHIFWKIEKVNDSILIFKSKVIDKFNHSEEEKSFSLKKTVANSSYK